jgi:hypothetical protein
MYELAEIKPKAAATAELEEKRQYLEKKKELAERLGLCAQVEVLKTDLRSLKSGVVSLPVMSKEEIAIWRAFLPNTYGTDYPNNAGTPISRYRFDRIPHSVLEQWAYCKDNELFNEYQIWTPEVAVVDPVLVGLCGENHHMIARWSESDANLLSLEDIKGVLRRRWLFAWIPAPFIVLLATLVIGLIVASAGHLPFLTVAAYVGAVASLIASAIVFKDSRRDKIMRAIRQHDKVARQ